MKKTRLFQSVMMLLACVALLVVGIYAVSPAQNNVTGTITVIASNVEVEITAYSSTNKSAATKISDTITARTSTPVPIYDNKLEFDGSNVANSDAVADMTMVLEIKNKSASKTLGAFFLKDATLPATLTRANITTSMDFDGKTADSTKTATDLVTVALQDYTEIGAGQTEDLVCTFSLNSLTDYDMNVDFTLPLVIHDYDEDLVDKSSSVTISTESDKSVSIQTSIGDSSYNNGVINSTTKLKSGLSEVAFTTESTDPIEVEFSITNQTNTELGAYFLDSSVSETLAFDSNGLVTANGIMVKTQINQDGNIVDVYLSTYSYLAKSGDAKDCDTIEMYITFYPTTIVSDCLVMFNFNLNIEEYVSNMSTSDLTTSSWVSSNGNEYGCVKSLPGNLIKVDSKITILEGYTFSLSEYNDTSAYPVPTEWGEYRINYIVIPSSVTTIGVKCFSHNSDLLGCFLPNSISSCSSSVFAFCSNLISVVLFKNVNIESVTFVRAGIINIKIPLGINKILTSAFMYSSLMRVVIPSSVSLIDSGAFNYCTSLTKIIIKRGTGDIKHNAELPAIDGKTWYLNGVAVTTNYLATSATCDNVYICK